MVVLWIDKDGNTDSRVAPQELLQPAAEVGGAATFKLFLFPYPAIAKSANSGHTITYRVLLLIVHLQDTYSGLLVEQEPPQSCTSR